jgi:predicted Zn-ribbon and HTH transcriptional regulator
MYRKDLVELLLNNPLTLYEIAKPLGLRSREVEDDLRHLKKSLKRGAYELIVHPARCHKCGFVFSPDHLHKPGRCPSCHGTWLEEPRFEVTARQR